MTAGDRAEQLHRTHFGRASDARAHASGRVNLIGDHVDYAGGSVLPMAIALSTHVAIARAARDDFVSEWANETAGDTRWMRYAAGVLAELRVVGIAVPPVTIAVASDVPVGGGLSSSAALEVAVARAALAITGATMTPRDLALLCQRAEHIHAGTPCGIMDQWCVAHALPGEAMLLDCARLEWKPIMLPSALEIEIVDSRVRHTLSDVLHEKSRDAFRDESRDGGYAARRADTEEAARMLGVALLAELPRARWREIDELPERIARRARHVVTECARVHEAVDALAANDLTRFGQLLFESHRSLRDDFNVSTPELDAIVEAARARGDQALAGFLAGVAAGGDAGNHLAARSHF
ncbi:MAG: galactokinase family protein, partial [Planctomycetota bacterium]